MTVTAVALIGIGLALFNLHAASVGIDVTAVDIGTIPATIFRPADPTRPPVVVIAHGFAGSQQLMQSFALAFARNGYIAVTFDFAGHGRNPSPLTGSITDANGATQTLLAELVRVGTYARSLGDGRLAVLGHSMASDIVVRYAEATPDVAATIAVSMFSPVVTAASPRNLLVIVGDWESMLKAEALRAVGLAIVPNKASPDVTYGDVAIGTGRRAAFSPHVEHASVLFSQDSMREALMWLDAVFGTPRAVPVLDQRGPWIMLLIAAVVILARPLSALLPRLASPSLGAGLGWRRLWVVLLVPMVATPLMLRVLPTHILPVLVGDYLAAHFAVYGVITAACLVATRRSCARRPLRAVSTVRFAGATIAVMAFGFVGLVWPINQFVTSFVPGPERLVLVAAMLVGTLIYFLSDEWATRGEGAGSGGYLASKIAFLASLALAVSFDFERLFFLIIIVPVITLFFVIYGFFSAWINRHTGHPLVAGIANAIAFAWAIGVTFPLLAG
ncbi:alpha/beta hydrolase [Lichenifustis flavocetrariae]|uniref:Alpha/beta fold hydrolase n=1 Tax=Lichenifustis flavocetrariae TaxID=2949735 RepID=A0AA41Z2U3_9HYPH|nr:alpha/beta fold hydrolase [Lichenifustis flavocetrariae]MCW6512699.1 alpha/beta fold hydrolase [Lichenifustis flavocetrariae]